MSGPLVVETPLGWVAADGGGWTDEVYATEAEARAAVSEGFDPFTAIPGYEEMDEEVQALWVKLKHLAVRVADIATGINTLTSPETVEELFEKYRVANEAFIRARDIRDDCYEAYLGDSKY